MALNKTASEEASVFSKTLLPATTGSSFFRRRRTDTGSLTLPAKIGLHRVSDGPDAPQVAIIFVHGLGGHPVTTWSYQRNPSKFWPREWLPSERGLEGASIYTFGYSADWATTKESTLTILDFAKKLNFDILMARLTDVPIIFVVHSMGGLVVKKAYMLALLDPMYYEVSVSVQRGAIVFLGTPHRGSDLAGTLNRLLSITIGFKSFVRELMANSSTLESINEEFRHCSKNLKLWSFYETQPTSTGPGRSSIIVERTSAVLGYDNEGSAFIDADHHTICKYESSEDPGYVAVSQLLTRFVANLPSQAGLDALPPANQVHEPRVTLSLTRLSQVLGQDDRVEDDLLFLLDSRVTGDSCQWIYEKEDFEWWCENPETKQTCYLWIRGPPAFGKSVLASSIVERLQEEGRNCAYYFFRANDAVGRTSRSFLLSIVAQAAKEIPEFYERLIAIDEGGAHIVSMSTRILWKKLFVDALFKCHSDQTSYWILDGLDEAENPGEVVSFIGKIPKKSQVRVLVTSRARMDLERDFRNLNLGSAIRQLSIQPADTKRDMMAHIDQQLESLPLDPEEREEVVSIIAGKAQGVFLWANLAVEEILATAHTKEGIYEALESLPSAMEDLFQRILHDMSENMRDTNKRLAKAILHHTMCAIRPLKTAELQALLEPEFGRLFKVEYTINMVCPHLLKIDEGTGQVQPIHATAREFLLQDPDSEFAVHLEPAHTRLAQISLEVWRANVFRRPISVQLSSTRNLEALDLVHPLLRYSTQAWFEHLGQSACSPELVPALVSFFRTDVLTWIEAVGLLNRLWWVTGAAQRLQQFVAGCPAIASQDRELLSGWAVDIHRIVPKFGKNIVSHPLSIHKLIPPLCPKRTRIGSQFAARGDITVVGSAMDTWDDCLAHITVGRNGELCKALVAGDNYFAVGLSDAKGTVVLYHAGTCQESLRFQHGDRLSAMDMSSTGEHMVTGGNKSLKVWDLSRAETTAQLDNVPGVRCLAVKFRPGWDTVLSVASNDTLTMWNIEDQDQQHLQFTRPIQHGRYRGAPWGVTFSSDSTRVVLAYKGWPLEVWNVEERQILETVEMRNPLGACLNPTNSDIYGVEQDGTILYFNGASKHQREVKAQSHVVSCSPDGKMLAAGNGEGSLKIYDSDTLEPIYTLGKYDESITALAFGPEGGKLYDIRHTDCNVWGIGILDSLLNASSIRGPEMSKPLQPSLEESGCPQDITAIFGNPTGEYVCVGKSDGTVVLYETRSGQQLQGIYNHAPTVQIESLVWSSNGVMIASGDNSGRVIAVSLLSTAPSGPWDYKVKLDIRMDPKLDGGVRQLVINQAGDRLLVSAESGSTVFSLDDGSTVGTRQIHEKQETRCWTAHPKDPGKLIVFASEQAKVYDWATFVELSACGGILLKHEPPSQGKKWQLDSQHIRTDAYATQDGEYIVTSISLPSERSASVKCSLWAVTGFKEGVESIEESRNLNNTYIESLIGVFKNSPVFLDRDLWLCTANEEDGVLARHFYVPFDWLNTSEERCATITPLGDFVYAMRGELIIVKRGMRRKQEFS